MNNASLRGLTSAIGLVLLLATPRASATEPRSAAFGAGATGKAAAHAALAEKADLPAAPPRLPDQSSEEAHAVPGKASLAGKAGAAHRAHGEAQQQAVVDARAARVEAADRAAQGSVAAAVRSANADSHAAAGQARAAAAKANAAAHPSPPAHPTTPSHP